jgi:hypothetical protein
MERPYRAGSCRRECGPLLLEVVGKTLGEAAGSLLRVGN